MSSTTTRRPRRHFGKIAKQRSGRYRASYVDPLGVRRYAERTFQSRGDASAWVSRRETESTDPNWSPPQPRRTLPRRGVRRRMDRRAPAQAADPRAAGLLRNHIEPSPLADVTLNALTPGDGAAVARQPRAGCLGPQHTSTVHSEAGLFAASREWAGSPEARGSSVKTSSRPHCS